jgi:polyphenol oxidase
VWLLHRREDNGLVFYQFETLATGSDLIHGVFTRLGGVSKPPFATLNLGRGVPDEPSAIDENYRRICATLGLDRSSLVTGYQTHSEHVVIVDDAMAGQLLPATDALITRSPRVALTLRFADCVPILLFDPVQRAIGIVHAGWKGTLSRIAGKTAEAMAASFGSRPSDLIAGIGPSIGPCCYEVGEDVRRLVSATFVRTDDLLQPRPGDRVHLDLWAANRRVLEDAGVQHIESGALCTSCHRHEFFSHRGEAGVTGRFGAFLALNQPQ